MLNILMFVYFVDIKISRFFKRRIKKWYVIVCDEN